MGDVKHHFKICTGCHYFCNEKESTEFCPFCGDKLINNCPRCREEIKTPYGNFCTKCGSLYPGRTTKKQNQ